MPKGKTDFVAILETLRRHRVQFVLVGGVAAVVEGVPVATFDVDVVHDRTEQNIRRLAETLRELRAVYRERPELCRVPVEGDLAGDGHHLLLTRYGPLDVLGMIGRGHRFAFLSAHSRRRKIAGGLVRVLDLETQIAIKEELGHAKDRAVLPTLRETLRERRRKGPGVASRN